MSQENKDKILMNHKFQSESKILQTSANRRKLKNFNLSIETDYTPSPLS